MGKKSKARPARKRTLRVRRSTARTMFDGRSRYPIIEELRAWMRAYGYGAEANQAREEFAGRCGTTAQYLIQLGLGYRQASLEMAVEIDKQTHGLVPAEVVNPNCDWDYLRQRALRPARIRIPGAPSIVSAIAP